MSQDWNPKHYGTHARFVSDLGEGLVHLLNPRPGERVLDLGCGDGVLTERLMQSGAIVTGVDSSQAMVEAARARGVDASLMDGESLRFVGEFDAVFSNAAMHWMKNTDAVAEGVFRSLRPGGRFIGEFGGFGNVAAICVAVFAVLERYGHKGSDYMPWTFPDVDSYRRSLGRAGFDKIEVELIPRPTPLPTDMSGWLRTFALPLYQPLDEKERDTAIRETTELLRPFLCDSQGRWFADYVRLRFVATRETNIR